MTIVDGVLDFLVITGEGGRGGDGAAYLDTLGGGVCGRELWEDDNVDDGLEFPICFILISLGSGVGGELGGAW